MEGKTKKKEGVEKEEVKLKKAASVPKKEHVYEDFYFELKGKAVNIFSSNGEIIKGIIQDTSRYMIKVEVEKGKVIYLNKAFIQKISLI
jgi:sRNA-binding regulator protein Hfq